MKMCTDCSVHDPLQGLDAHPIFQTDFDYAEHRRTSHGGPTVAATRPNTRADNSPAGPTVRGSLNPGAPSTSTAAAVVELDIQELKQAVETLQAQVGGQAAINEDLQRRLTALESTPERLKPIV